MDNVKINPKGKIEKSPEEKTINELLIELIEQIEYQNQLLKEILSK